MKLSKNFFLPSLLLCISTAAICQSKSSSDTGLTLNHIAIYVHDLKKSTAFYEDVLGLVKIEEPFHDGRHTWFTMGSAGNVHLIQGADSDVKREKNDHLCFSVKSVEDFIANLDKHHVTYTNWPGTAKAPTIRVDGVKQIYFQDPDGHWIEINNDRLVNK